MCAHMFYCSVPQHFRTCCSSPRGLTRHICLVAFLAVRVVLVVVVVINHTVVASRGMVVVGHVCLSIRLPSIAILGIMGQHLWYWVQWVILDLVELDHVVVQMLLATFVVSMATSNVIVGHCRGSSSSRMVVHVRHFFCSL